MFFLTIYASSFELSDTWDCLDSSLSSLFSATLWVYLHAMSMYMNFLVFMAFCIFWLSSGLADGKGWLLTLSINGLFCFIDNILISISTNLFKLSCTLGHTQEPPLAWLPLATSLTSKKQIMFEVHSAWSRPEEHLTCPIYGIFCSKCSSKLIF